MRIVQKRISAWSRSRNSTLASTLIAFILLVPVHVLAQDNAERLADTFDQRYPAEQSVPSATEQPPVPNTEQAPKAPPSDQTPFDALGLRGTVQQHHIEANKPQISRAPQSRPQVLAPDRNDTKGARRAPTAGGKRPPSRVVVVARSFLDAGTEVLAGERKFLDYAFSPTHTAMDVVTSTGGRVGWHKSPLPGPLFPVAGPW